MALWVCPVVAPGSGLAVVVGVVVGRWQLGFDHRRRQAPKCCCLGIQAANGVLESTSHIHRGCRDGPERAWSHPAFVSPPSCRPAEKRFLHGDKRFYARPTTFFGDGNPTPHIKFASLFTFPPELLHLASSIHLPSSHHTLIPSLIPPPNRKNGQDQGRQDQQQQEGQGRARRREGRRQGSEGRR